MADKVNSLDNKQDSIEKSIDLLDSIFSNLDLNKIPDSLDKSELDYSKILYYSMVFNNNDYNKILSFVFENTNIFGIYKCGNINGCENKSTSEQIEIIKEKQNDKCYDFKKDFSPIISKLTPGDIFAIGYNNFNNVDSEQNKTLYKLNEKFHTTMLYLGGTKDIRALELEQIIGKEINVKIISISISNKFIVCGIELEDKSIPYYGNPIQHITIGLKKTDSNKFKLFPKDSPTAFDEGIKINLDHPLEISGMIVKELKENKKNKESNGK